MKRLQKILAVFLALTLLCCCIPVAAAATEGIYQYTVVQGNATITGFTGTITEEELILPDTLGGYPVTAIGAGVFQRRCSAKTVVIPESVKDIGKYAFQNSDIKVIYIYAKELRVESSSFNYTGQTIYLYESASCAMNAESTALIYLDDYPCDPRTLVPVEEGSLTYAVYEGEAILLSENSTGTKAVSVPETLGGCPVTAIGPHCFKNSHATYTLPDTVRSIGTYAFCDAIGCKLTTLPAKLQRISRYGTAGVTPEDGILPEGLKKICNCGCNAWSTDTLTIPGTVETIGAYAFLNSSIREITIEDGVKTLGERCFLAVDRLEKITVPASVTECGVSLLESCENVTVYGYLNTPIFTYCGEAGIPFVDLETGVYYGKPYMKTLDGVKYQIRPGHMAIVRDLLDESMEDVVIPETVDDVPVRKVYDSAFASEVLRSVVLPDTVTTLDPFAFASTPALEYVSAPGLERIGMGCFANSALVFLLLPESVTQIDQYAFEGTEIVLVGISGSYAEDYARANQRRFLAVDKDGYYVSSGTGLYEIVNKEAVLIATDATRLSDGETFYAVPDTVGVYPVTTIGANAEFLGKDTGTATLVLGSNVTTVEPTALLGTGINILYTTPAVTSLPTPLFDTSGTIYGYSGSYAEEYAAKAGYSFHAMDALPFRDVKETDWFYDAVWFCYWHNLMAGTSEQTFEPNAKTSRAMLVTVLWRLCGCEDVGTWQSLYFKDVPSDMWFTNAVNWAAKYGVVAGTSATTFSPNTSISREQVATILFRFAALVGEDNSQRADISAFSDGAKVSSWAKDGMQWAVSVGLILGKDDNGKVTLDPQGSASRAEISAILMRLVAWLNQ